MRRTLSRYKRALAVIIVGLWLAMSVALYLASGDPMAFAASLIYFGPLGLLAGFLWTAWVILSKIAASAGRALGY